MTARKKRPSRKSQPKEAVLHFWHRDRNGDPIHTVSHWPREVSEAELRKVIEDYSDNLLLPGGIYRYVTESLGYAPLPYRAELRTGKDVLLAAIDLKVTQAFRQGTADSAGEQHETRPAVASPLEVPDRGSTDAPSTEHAVSMAATRPGMT